MDNIEQLKQENEKLQERLNNAAKFFREQKANIDTLTVQVKTAESDKENAFILYKEADKQVGELRIENESLNNQLTEYDLKLKNSEAAYEELRKKYGEMKELHDGDLTRYNELEDNYEGLQNRYKELQDEYAKLDENNEDAYTKIEELQVIIDKDNKRLENASELQNKINELNKLYADCENEKLAFKADYASLEEKYESLKSQLDVDKEDYEKYKKFVNALFVKAKEFNINLKYTEEPKKKETTQKIENANIQKTVRNIPMNALDTQRGIQQI